MSDFVEGGVEVLLTGDAPDFVEGGVEVLLTGDAPDFVEGGVEVLLSNAPSRPAWIPLYVFDKEWGWLPTFPRWLFDQHPPRN